MSMNRKRRAVPIVFFILLLAVVSAEAAEEPKAAAPAEEKKIVSLEVEGNRARSRETILANVKIKPGMTFTQKILNEELKRLYATGYFTDVSLDLEETPEGFRVKFLVKERPVIAELLISGNKVITEEKLRQSIRSRAGETLNLKTLNDDLEEIRKLYENSGFPQTQVIHEINVTEATNRATVMIVVTEGSKVKIRRIAVEGNKNFPTRRILKLLKTKRASLFNSGRFREETFEKDRETVVAFYRNAGYLDVKVDYRLDYQRPDRRHLKLVLIIDEGRKYVVGAIRIEGNRICGTEELLYRMEMKTGAAFTPEGQRQDYLNIQNCYFDKGYLNNQIKMDSRLNEETGRVDLSYQVSEGQLTYVEKVDIRGNELTKDLVIRRELRLVPGDAFNGQKLRRSMERLHKLEYFEDISYEFEPGSAEDRKNLVLNVKEAKTGELSLGMGYSSVDRMVGFIDLAQKNFDLTNFPYFRGAGQRMRMRARFGTEAEEYDLSFTEPWIFQRPLSFGFDLYRNLWERSGFTGYGYDEERVGGDLRLGRILGEFSRADLTYRLEDVKISNVEEDTHPDIVREEGKNTISSMDVYLERDTRDNNYNPTRGWYHYGDIEVAGGPFGGDKEFVKFRLGTNWDLSPLPKTVLELKLRGGWAGAYGNSEWIPIYERFFVGGADSVRGYKERSIGPRLDGDPAGGRLMLVGNAEYTVPLVENLRGAIFYDTGYTWEKPGDFSLSDLKSGIGVGLRLKTPIGPISIDYGYALNPEPDEGRSRFHFGTSHVFY